MPVTLAFVIPWFGPDIPGGAEAVCRTTARKLFEAGVRVEVGTTCVRDFHGDWNEDHHPPGTTDWDGIPVHRFRVRRRDQSTFDRINRYLMRSIPVGQQEQMTFIREMIGSDELVRWMEQRRQETVYLLMPYPYGTTYWGALACPERSVLVPCLHDEAYAHLEVYRPMFERARGTLFLTPAERELACRLFQLRAHSVALVGAGIDPPPAADGAAFRARHRLKDYLLYAGRKSPGKNTPLLLDWFRRWRRERGSDLQLVLIGTGEVEIPERDRPHVRDLGWLSRQEQADAYAGALALCQPSKNESFSIVIMEAWAAGCPVLVHGDCPVTKDHCLFSSGGLFFTSPEEFAGCLDWLLEHPAERARMAANGARYVRANYAWDRVVERYLRALRGWGFDV